MFHEYDRGGKDAIIFLSSEEERPAGVKRTLNCT
jgi:hypothetical protein